MSFIQVSGGISFIQFFSEIVPFNSFGGISVTLFFRWSFRRASDQIIANEGVWHSSYLGVWDAPTKQSIIFVWLSVFFVI